jgi:SAM-dependent methyltransferase
METVSCNLCGSTEYTLLYHIPDLLLGSEGELFTLVKCIQCGLVYQNPRPTQEEIGRYYPSDYEPYFHERNENWLMRKVKYYGIIKRCRIINSIKANEKGGRLLDIGCSTGLFINELRQTRSWEVWGNDTSEYATKIAHEQFKLDVFHGTLVQANYPTGFFDVVTLWDVLEHLPDPSGTLKEISRITKAQSYLVLRLPNYDSFDSKLFRSTWAGLDLPRHLYIYSKQNLIRLLGGNGYHINKIRGDIGTYPTFLLSIRFWLTSRAVDSLVRNKIIQVLNHPISRLVSAPFFYFYGYFQLGSEITVIAKKM